MSLRGPVITPTASAEGASLMGRVGQVGRGDGNQKCPLIFFILCGYIYNVCMSQKNFTNIPLGFKIRIFHRPFWKSNIRFLTQTRPFGPRRKGYHWTPKGHCRYGAKINKGCYLPDTHPIPPHQITYPIPNLRLNSIKNKNKGDKFGTKRFPILHCKSHF